MKRAIQSICFVAILFLLIGCASKTVSVGSKTWHEGRIAEIEEAYQNKEIDKEKYLQLKLQADKIRQKYYDKPRVYPSVHYGIYKRY